MIIDATDLIIGRLASVAAKSALLGEEVHVINCEKAVISGDRKKLIEEYARKRSMGIPAKGPFHHRKPELHVKRVIRGMLPYKQPKGMVAFKRIRCHAGVPEELRGKETAAIKGAGIEKLPVIKYITVGELCKVAGGKI